MQQQIDPTADPTFQARARLTARWIDTATRPDLYPPPVQHKNADRAAQPASHIHQLAAAGISGAATDLPHIDQIQQSFGAHDVKRIKAHVGGPAAEGSLAMGAEAYATGDHVAFRREPDLHTAAHEAAHVVQQRAGVHLQGGVGTAGDAYERQADAVADRVVQGRSAEDLFETAGTAQSEGAVQQRATAGVVQRNPLDTARAQHEARGQNPLSTAAVASMEPSKTSKRTIQAR